MIRTLFRYLNDIRYENQIRTVLTIIAAQHRWGHLTRAVINDQFSLFEEHSRPVTEV